MAEPWRQSAGHFVCRKSGATGSRRHAPEGVNVLSRHRKTLPGRGNRVVRSPRVRGDWGVSQTQSIEPTVVPGQESRSLSGSLSAAAGAAPGRAARGRPPGAPGAWPAASGLAAGVSGNLDDISAGWCILVSRWNRAVRGEVSHAVLPLAPCQLC